MSSKPSASGVCEVRDLLRRRASVGTEIGKIRQQAERMEDLETNYRMLTSDILKAIQNMDVSTGGNTGWEGRLLWFLTELESQSRSA